MGIFGEAIYGHDGQYKARVYNAQYVRSADGTEQITGARGLTEQDALNRVFANTSIGPQNDSTVILALNTGMKGYSWAVRAARQTGSLVSAGYCHAVYSSSTLSNLYRIDEFLYFPFIPNGDYCVSLLRDTASFNARERWGRNMQSVPVTQSVRNRELGASLNISKDLLKRLIPYIVSQTSISARQYLYIRVPDQAPYEAYCLAALHDILRLIPAGLRAGISAATNSDPQQEQHFGILFQRASFPARHAVDIDLHRNAAYSFLDQLYISPSMQNLLKQIVDYPDLADKCYRTMERQVFGEELPKSYQSYENYYGISTIQQNQTRPTYLEECNRLLETTTEPTLRSILGRILLDEFKSSKELDAVIERDPSFTNVHSFAELTAYMQARNRIFTFLENNGIRYSAMLLYGRLTTIANDTGVRDSIDFYEKVVSEQQDLRGLSEADQKKIIGDSRKSAWEYFIQMRCSARGDRDERTAADQYIRLVNLDGRIDPGLRPPLSEADWYNTYQRQCLITQFRESHSPETAEKLFSIPGYDRTTGKPTYLTVESRELIRAATEMMEGMIGRESIPETAKAQINELIVLEGVFKRYFDQWIAVYPEDNPDRKSFYDAYERALGTNAISYTAGSEVTGEHLSAALQLIHNRMPQRGKDCRRTIEISIAERIRVNQIPWQNRLEIYKAASVSDVDPFLKEVYSEWVAAELQKSRLEAAKLQELYQSVREPDIQLRAAYEEWSQKKGLIEKMNASRTMVKYLNLLLTANRNMSESEITAARKKMWAKLTVQERTISAFVASIAYLFDKPAGVILSDPKCKREVEILKSECNALIEYCGMGIYLDPDISLSELYENIQQYCQWSGYARVNLYTRNEIHSSRADVERDLEGSNIYSQFVETRDLKNTLKGLLCLLDGADYSVFGGGKAVNPGVVLQELKNQKTSMSLLRDSGILKNYPNLMLELDKHGYSLPVPRRKKDFPIIKYALGAGIGLLLFVLGAVISHFAWPRMVQKPEEGQIAAGSEVVTDASEPPADTIDHTEEPEPTDATVNVQQQSTGEVHEVQDEINGIEEQKPAETENSNIESLIGKEVALPPFTATDEGEAFQTICKYTPNVMLDNKISVGDEQVLLPGNAERIQTQEGDYFAVKYTRWDYDKNKNELIIKYPRRSVFVGYIQLSQGTDGSEIYGNSMITSGNRVNDEHEPTSEEITSFFLKSDSVPEEVISKILEMYSSKNDFTLIQDTMERYIKQCSEKEIIIEKMIFNGEPYDYDSFTGKFKTN